MDTAPKRITVGVVGTNAAADGLRWWLNRCGSSIDRKVPKPGQENLFVDFPGFNTESGFLAELVHADSLVREIPNSDIRRLAGGVPPRSNIRPRPTPTRLDLCRSAASVR